MDDHRNCQYGISCYWWNCFNVYAKEELTFVRQRRPNGKNSDVFDYIEWRGDLTFQQSSFNEVDALILSIFAYLDFSFIKKKSCSLRML